MRNVRAVQNMYRAAEEIINRGLSSFSRILLGLFSGLFGVVMVITAPDTDKAIFFYMFGGLCFLICFTCAVQGKPRQFLGSVIGICLFFVSLVYSIYEILGGSLVSGNRDEPSAINAILFLMFFGIPGLRYAMRVRFGKSK